jgi:UDP-glucuronate 4-epimerase
LGERVTLNTLKTHRLHSLLTREITRQDQDATIIVTGAAGFIGFHVGQRLTQAARRVIGVDSVNDYYDVSLKEARLDVLRSQPLFHFEKLDLANQN